VEDAAVVGVPDAAWGQVVAAAVQQAAGETATEAVLIAHCEASLAKYKVPKSISFVTDLPRSSGGKVMRRAVLTQMRPAPTRAPGAPSVSV
jgi:acyl-CoA synthetase (AMP-forming)/AMP-acid ligase II